MHDELSRRLQSFRIDAPDTALPFVRRLAHENGWNDAFARRVVAEYFRFVWLAMRAGHPVTPSPAVDEAWHLHLCYTRSYWDELCGQVLGRPLHHGPTRGGAAEDAKHADWYTRTLTSYREHFGEPPADVWPAPAERFRGGIPRKVDARSHWVLPKRTVQRALQGAVAVGLLGLLCGCVGAALDDTAWLWVVGGAVALVLGIAFGMRNKRPARRRRGDGGAGGCTMTTGCAVGLGHHAHGLHGGGGGGGEGRPGHVPHHGHGHGHDPSHGHGGDHGGGDTGGASGGDGGGGSSGGDGGGSSGCGGGGCGGGGGGGGD